MLEHCVHERLPPLNIKVLNDERLQIMTLAQRLDPFGPFRLVLARGVVGGVL